MSCQKLIFFSVFALCLSHSVNSAATKTASAKDSAQIQEIVDLISKAKYEEARDLLWKLPDPVRGMRLVANKFFQENDFQGILSFFPIADDPKTPCKLYAAGMGVVIDESLALASAATPDDLFTVPTIKAQLALYSQRWQKNCGNVTGDPDAISITNRFNVEVDKAIEWWAEEIRNGNDYLALTLDRVDLSEYFPRLVHSAYAGNSSNVVSVAHFISKYERVYWKALGWTQLLNELQEDKNVETISKPMLAFSHYFLQDMADENTQQNFAKQENGNEAQTMYAQIQKQIPEGLKTLVSGKSCVLVQWNAESAKEASLQKDANPQGESIVVMRSRLLKIIQGRWRLTPFIAKRYKPDDHPVRGGKFSQLRFVVKYSSGDGDNLCVLTQNQTETGQILFGSGNHIEKTGYNPGLCPDSDMDRETTSTWQLEPVARGNATVFRMITGNQDGPSYALHAKKNSREVEVTQVKGKGAEGDSGYHWYLDC